MKRILALAAAAVAAGTMVLPASAASTYTYGSVKLQWNVPLTATLNVHTNYTAAGAFGTAANTLLPSSAGVCTSQTSGETDLNMNYGTLAVSPSAVVACTYKNAVAMQLTTNAKYQVNEYLDTTTEVPSGTGFCAYPNGLTFGGPGSAAATQSTRSADPGLATFTSGTISACATGGTYVPVASGTISNSGAAPAQPNATYTGEYLSGGTGLNVIGSATPPSGVVWAGEDLQLNLDKNAPATSGATSAFMTIQLVNN